MTRRLAVAAVAAALLTAPLLEPALAKKQRAKTTALVDGKKFKSPKIGTSLIYASTSFSVNGQTKAIEEGRFTAFFLDVGI